MMEGAENIGFISQFLDWLDYASSLISIKMVALSLSNWRLHSGVKKSRITLKFWDFNKEGERLVYLINKWEFSSFS